VTPRPEDPGRPAGATGRGAGTPVARLDAQAAALRAAMTTGWDRGAQRHDTRPGHGLRTDHERDAWLLLLRRLLPQEVPRGSSTSAAARVRWRCCWPNSDTT
jgi:hypothetical protein